MASWWLQKLSERMVFCEMLNDNLRFRSVFWCSLPNGSKDKAAFLSFSHLAHHPVLVAWNPYEGWTPPQTEPLGTLAQAWNRPCHFLGWGLYTQDTAPFSHSKCFQRIISQIRKSQWTEQERTTELLSLIWGDKRKRKLLWVWSKFNRLTAAQLKRH